MSYEATGKIHYIGDIKEFNDGAFKKRELVILIQSGQFENILVLEAIQDKCNILDNFKLGDEVQVSFFISGNKNPYKKTLDGPPRWFNCLRLNYITEYTQDGNYENPVTGKAANISAPVIAIPKNIETEEDIPF